MTKPKNLLTIIGGILVAASSIFYVTGCSSTKPQTEMTQEEWNRYIAEVWNPAVSKQNAKRQEEENAKIRAWNYEVTEQNAKRQAQNNYQTSPQQNNFQNNVDKAITEGAGDFVGDVLFYEYLKK